MTTARSAQDLVARYRRNFSVADDFPLTAETCEYHWVLERELTQRLWRSSPQTRWETFEQCYTKLYAELHWLYTDRPPSVSPAELEQRHGYWRYWLGPAPQKIYEVGSGRGELITCLASLGYECKGTEVTRERGRRWAPDVPGLSWGTTDGVHLAQFEPVNSYDAVISDQVIEHLHPDDLPEHFVGALEILKPGGKYVFRTPHVHDGPSDVSRFFGSETPKGMHLREYTYRELANKLKRAGFTNVRTWSPRPRVLYRAAKIMFGTRRLESAYLHYLYALESLIMLLPWQALRRRAAHFGPRPLRFEPSLVMLADKPIPRPRKPRPLRPPPPASTITAYEGGH